MLRHKKSTTREDTPAIAEDLFPTILDIAGVSYDEPGAIVQELDGQSLIPGLIAGGSAEGCAEGSAEGSAEGGAGSGAAIVLVLFILLIIILGAWI